MLGKSVVASIVCLSVAVNVDADQFPNGPGDPSCPDDLRQNRKIGKIGTKIVDSHLFIKIYKI